MKDAADRLWKLTGSNSGIRANDLLLALADPELTDDSNPRTPILVRDSISALERLWGLETFAQRISRLTDFGHLTRFASRAGDDHGFPSLERRTMDATGTDDILAVFRELGISLNQPAELIVGGSTALILDSHIIHKTEDIDVVDEVPESIRTNYPLLETIRERFPLQLTHFQSHYLPDGWRERTKSLGHFGKLSVRVVDSIDILVGKLFSRRNKDYVHVAEAWRLIDQPAFRDRIAHFTANLRSDALSLDAAKHNWYVLTGEADLPAIS